MIDKNKMTSDTIHFYKSHASEYIQETRDIDFSKTEDMFLRCVRQGGKILDFGCGAGRDSKYFLEKGYEVDAVDGCQEMADAAAKLTGLPVKKMLFTDLNAVSEYDGIWACASILHCSREELDLVVDKVMDALVPGGVFYASFKYGEEDTCKNGRWFSNFNEFNIGEMFEGKDVVTVKKWVTNDVRPGRDNERWMNIIVRKRRKYHYVQE